MRILKPLPGALPMPGRNIVGDWSINSLGDEIFDRSGNDNAGTILGPVWSIGTYGHALKFNGINDYVEMGALDIFEGIPAITYCLWVYPSDNADTYKFALSKDVVITLGTRANSYRWSLETSIGGTNGRTVGTISLNQWQFMCVRFDGNTCQLFKNCISIDSVPASGITKVEADLLDIGDFRQNNLHFYFWDGLIDIVSIYNCALSVSELVKLYREPFYRYPENRVFAVA